MRLVSPILKRVVYPCLADSGYLRWRSEHGNLCVVTYHGVLPAAYETIDAEQDGALVTANTFRRQLRLLKSRYLVVSPEHVLNWACEGKELPRRSVLLTCDDGLLNTLTEMAPILKEEGLSCLFFVLGASTSQDARSLWYEDLYLLLLAAPSGTFSLDRKESSLPLSGRASRRSAWWKLVQRWSQYDQSERPMLMDAARIQLGLSDGWNVEHMKSDAQRRRFSLLNLCELRQLAGMGMCVGSHTLSHPVLSQQPPELAWKEISESRSLLEMAVGKPVWALAYPYGDPASVTAREWEMAERAGFQCAFMNVAGGFGAPLPRFALPRVHVTAEMSLPEFEAHVSGFHGALQGRLSRQA